MLPLFNTGNCMQMKRGEGGSMKDGHRKIAELRLSKKILAMTPPPLPLPAPKAVVKAGIISSYPRLILPKLQTLMSWKLWSSLLSPPPPFPRIPRKSQHLGTHLQNIKYECPCRWSGSPLHCKNRFAIFPSPAWMSVTKLSLAGRVWLLTPWLNW